MAEDRSKTTPSLNAKEFIQVLRKQGFKYHGTNGSHFVFIYGTRKIQVPYHKGKDIKFGLLRDFLIPLAAEILGVTVENFIQLALVERRNMERERTLNSPRYLELLAKAYDNTITTEEANESFVIYFFFFSLVTCIK